MQLFIIIGIAAIIISGLFLGVLSSGSDQRANYHSETKEHGNFRTKMAIIFGLIGMFSFCLAGVIYIL